MNIPFEVDPPRNDKNKFKSKNSLKLSKDISSFDGNIKKPISVTQLTIKIKNKLENEFHTLIVEGELSNFKKASSGHLYFVLKDDQSQIRCVMFKQFVSNNYFQPENGLDVTVRGYLSVYRQRGEYQIITNSIEPKGIGALQLAFDQLKIKLESEGLFSKKFKKKIPFLPRKIGILTSSSGAVIHDMIKVLDHRFSEIPILLFPVQVQGEFAVKSIVEGIKYLNTLHDSHKIDVLILGRGGGSMEDLWSFNDEKLARTIFSSEIPIISAVGHETDFTISDFVSDLRAPTPSAAIELAVPRKKDLEYSLDQKQKRLNSSIQYKTSHFIDYYNSIRKRLNSPLNNVRQNAQLVDDLDSLLHERKNHQIKIMKNYFEKYFEKFLLLNPKREVLKNSENLYNLTQRLKKSFKIIKKDLDEKIKQKINILNTLSPLSIIDRGYSVTLDSKGKSLKSIKDTNTGENLKVRMKDGILETKVTSIIPNKK